MKIRTEIRWLDIAVKRYHRHVAKPVMPVRTALQKALGKINVLATYDHLRSPIPNRICTGDLRLSSFIEATGANAVLLLLDILQPPGDRPHGSQRGLGTGLGLFSKAYESRDTLGRPRIFLHRQRALQIPKMDESTIHRKVGQAAYSWARERNIAKPQARRASAIIEERAHHLTHLYRSIDKMKPQEGLLELRRKLWKLIDLPQPQFRLVPLSSISEAIAEALEAAAIRGIYLTQLPQKSLGNSGLFTYLHLNGTRQGVVTKGYQKGRFQILHDKGNSCLSFDTLLQAIADRRAIPSTLVLFALLHKLAGFPAFGESYNLEERLSAWSNVPRAVTLTLAETSTPTVGSVQIDNRNYRHIPVDLLIFEPDDLKNHVYRAAEIGKQSYMVDMVQWMKDIHG